MATRSKITGIPVGTAYRAWVCATIQKDQNASWAAHFADKDGSDFSDNSMYQLLHQIKHQDGPPQDSDQTDDIVGKIKDVADE